MTTLPPRQPGYWMFRGERRKGGTAYVETISAPVEVVEVVYYGKPRELAVKMIGRQQAFQLANFTGEWERLEVEPLS